MKKRQYNQNNIKGRYTKDSYKQKSCKWCNNLFQPLASSHLFCSDNCKDISFTNSYFKKKYGITFAEVKELLEKQNYQCAVCHTNGFKMHPNSWSSLNVDHDHETGKVRGMLCHNCNRALGLLQDNIKHLQSAIKYLEGATTISKESTYKCTEAHDIH